MQLRDGTDNYGREAPHDFSTLRDTMRIGAVHSGVDEQLTNNTVIAPIDTHWTRILHCDLLATPVADRTPDPGDVDKEDRRSSDSDSISRSSCGDDKEFYVAADGSVRDAGSHRSGSANHTATTRLAVFIAIYTAVAGVVHFLFWPDAAAVVPDSSLASASIATAPNSLPLKGQPCPDQRP